MAIALGLRRRSPRALESPNKDTSKRESPDSYNPYLAARREWDERYGDHIVRARNWRTMAALCGVIALSKRWAFFGCHRTRGCFHSWC